MKRILIALAALAAVATSSGTAAAAVTCNVAPVGPPINETMMFCPADAAAGLPAHFKSFTLDRGGFGYLVGMFRDKNSTHYQIWYYHRDGRVAKSAEWCIDGAKCLPNGWNGIEFPYGTP